MFLILCNDDCFACCKQYVRLSVGNTRNRNRNKFVTYINHLNFCLVSKCLKVKVKNKIQV